MTEGTYIELGEVRTWYAEAGSGSPLVLMHGGSTDARFFVDNLSALAEHFHVYTPERRGHGHSPDLPGPITYEVMAADTILFLEQVVGRPADLVGHSDGAVTAMVVAMRRPDLVERLVMVSGGFNKRGVVDMGSELDVDEVMAYVGPAYAEVSPDGPEHLRVVIEKIAEMAATEPNFEAGELVAITARTLVMFSDDDLTTLPHALELYEGISDCELAVIPGTSHFLLQEKPELCNRVIVDFLIEPPAVLVAPVRRAD